MKNDIKEKLQIVLIKEYLEESDVVYILSRIRKILEIDKKLADFKKLKFYCDWSLHSQIDNTDAVKDELANFPDDIVESYHFVNHGVFHEEFNRFLKEYQLKTHIYDNANTALHFAQILNHILSDTPLIVKIVKKKKITFYEKKFGEDYGLDYTVTEE